MNNAYFWASVQSIIAEGFTPEGLQKLDSYVSTKCLTLRERNISGVYH